jgi:elongation factor G
MHIKQGMGELHLDIIKDRILKEYKLKAYFGPLNIAYKELPTVKATKLLNYEKSWGEKKNSIQIELTVVPAKSHVFESVELVNQGENNFQDFPVEYLNSINHGVKSALNKGIYFDLT